MEHESRPKVTALVAYFCPPFGCVTEPRVMPLEDAADFAQFGFAVLVDPQDEADLVRYEQLQRVTRRRWL